MSVRWWKIVNFENVVLALAFFAIIYGYAGFRKTWDKETTLSPIDSCIEAIKSSVRDGDNTFRMVCVQGGVVVEVGQVSDEVEMPGLLSD